MFGNNTETGLYWYAGADTQDFGGEPALCWYEIFDIGKLPPSGNFGVNITKSEAQACKAILLESQMFAVNNCPKSNSPFAPPSTPPTPSPTEPMTSPPNLAPTVPCPCFNSMDIDTNPEELDSPTCSISSDSILLHGTRPGGSPDNNWLATAGINRVNGLTWCRLFDPSNGFTNLVSSRITEDEVASCQSILLESQIFAVNNCTASNFPTMTPPPTLAPVTSPPIGTPTLEPAPPASPSTPPTPSPTDSPTPSPTDSPLPSPTDPPTPAPTMSPPTGAPTVEPTPLPTGAPTTSPLTTAPTVEPTPLPTSAPSTSPPTSAPTVEPTPLPTDAPTTVLPTPVPTTSPSTGAPTVEPTPLPTITPTTTPTTPAPTTTSPPSLAPTVPCPCFSSMDIDTEPEELDGPTCSISSASVSLSGTRPGGNETWSALAIINSANGLTYCNLADPSNGFTNPLQARFPQDELLSCQAILLNSQMFAVNNCTTTPSSSSTNNNVRG